MPQSLFHRSWRSSIASMHLQKYRKANGSHLNQEIDPAACLGSEPHSWPCDFGYSVHQSQMYFSWNYLPSVFSVDPCRYLLNCC